MANISSIEVVNCFDASNEGANFLVETTEFFVPLNGLINEEEEIAKIKSEIDHILADIVKSLHRILYLIELEIVLEKLC